MKPIPQYPSLVVLKARCADYESHGRELQTDPMMNLFQDFSRMRMVNKLLKPGLLDDNRKVFRRLWGKPSFCYHGEFYSHCWLLGFQNSKLLVLTAGEKGTAYEAVLWHNQEKSRFEIKEGLAFIQYLSQVLPKMKDPLQTVEEPKREDSAYDEYQNNSLFNG